MDETEIDLRAILGLLRRRLRLILATIVLVVGAAALVTVALTPKYTASVLVLFDPSSRTLVDPQIQGPSASSESARVDSEVEIIKSDAVLLDTIRRENLLSDHEFGVSLGLLDRLLLQFNIAKPELPSGEAALRSVLNKLRGALSVSRRGLTYLITVSLTAESPDTAARLANAVAQAYVDAQVQNKIDAALAARNVLQKRLDSANAAITAAEQSFDDFIGNNIDAITRETGRQDLAQLQSELEGLVEQRRLNSSTSAAIENDMQAGNWLQVASGLQDEAVAQLARQREQVASRLSNVTEGSDTAINLRSELQQLDQQLEQEAKSGLSHLQQTIASQQSQASALRDQLRQTVVTGDLPPDILTQIYGIQQNAEVARSRYQSLLSRLRDLEAQSETQLAESRVVSPALAPNVPSFPNKKLFMALAGLSALGLGVGLAFLYENYVGGFVSEGQIESVVQVPVVSVVPEAEAPKLENGAESAAQLMVTKPLAIFAESIRRLRASLDQILDMLPAFTKAHNPSEEGQRGKVVMISSAIPSEGKSTICVALGRAYAQAGLRAVIVDCDLRKPSLHRHLGKTLSSGLADYLGGPPDDAKALASVIVHDDETDLYAIVGSHHSETPTDQLAGGRSLARLVEACREKFDVVILDTPPLGPVVDGMYLAHLADAVALVVKWASTSQTEVRSAVRAMRQSAGQSVPIVAVLNQDRSSKWRFYYKYGDYYTS